MASFRAAMNRVLSLFQRRRIDADLDDEVRAHLELLASEDERRGSAPARLAWLRAAHLEASSK